MAVNREEVVDQNLVRFLKEAAALEPGESGDPDAPLVAGFRLTGRQAVDLLDSQFTARHLDLVARKLKAENKAFYTIGSAGHEGNAAVALALRPTDMGFLHYRSGAFMAQHAKSIPDESQIYNVALSLVASSDDPVSGGRHKVFGSKRLNIPPQTSTIASQVPKAVGAAFSISRAKKLGLDTGLPEDAVIYCSFGDASLGHSTCQGAINAAQWAACQSLPVPIVFVCEDNGIGISVHTPESWVRDSIECRPGLKYFGADGLNIAEAYEAADDAVEYARAHRRPAFLHLKVVRMLGHAGSDVELQYHSIKDIEATEAMDPLLTTSRLVIEAGLMTADAVLSLYESIRRRVAAAGDEACARPTLDSKEKIISALAPFHADAVAAEAARADYQPERVRLFGGEDKLPEKSDKPRHLGLLLNQSLRDMLAKYPEAIIFGEDVAKKGGVYHVTAGLMQAAGPARVFNTLLDEQSILGMAQGAAHLGFLPLPEIQYLAYFHNACDQIRGEAASLQFFSQGQFRNPMVIRIAGFAYQKGFGGHFHNDNSIAALRDIPGVVIAAPSRGDDAVKMMRTCMALAKVDGRVVFFLEPIALYMSRDLHEPGDGKWECDFPAPGESIALGEGRAWHAEDGDELCLVSFANGLHMSLQACLILHKQHKIRARVLDLRWLNPINHDWIAEHARATGRVLVVDETRRSGGLAEPILAALAERDTGAKLFRHNAEDTYVPLGGATKYIMPTVESIVQAALLAMGREENS